MVEIKIGGNRLLVKRAPPQSDKFLILSKLPSLAINKDAASKAQRLAQAALARSARLIRYTHWNAGNIVVYEAKKKTIHIQLPAAIIGLVLNAAMEMIRETTGPKDEKELNESVKTYKNAAMDLINKTTYDEGKNPSLSDLNEAIAECAAIYNKIPRPTLKEVAAAREKKFKDADDFVRKWGGLEAETKSKAATFSRTRSNGFGDFF